MVPLPLKQGIAPPMSADGRGIIWGQKDKPEGVAGKQRQALGGQGANEAHCNIRQNVGKFDTRVKAREVVQVQL